MDLRTLIGATTLLAALAGPAALCSAGGDAVAERHANWRRDIDVSRPWHGNHYHPAFGAPVALVTPPTAGLQTVWNWGVTNTRVTRVSQQFGRPWPGPAGGGTGFAPMPAWPGSTNHFGVYYVRGPW